MGILAAGRGLPAERPPGWGDMRGEGGLGCAEGQDDSGGPGQYDGDAVDAGHDAPGDGLRWVRQRVRAVSFVRRITCEDPSSLARSSVRRRSGPALPARG